MIAEKSSGFTHNRGSLGFWIFVVVCAYFGLAEYWLSKSAIWTGHMILSYATYLELLKVPWWAALFYSSELFGSVAILLRGVAGFLALYAGALFLRKKEAALPQIRGSVSKCLILESGYYLCLIPSVIIGFVYPFAKDLWYFEPAPPELIVLLVDGVACLEMAVVVPLVLLKLRSKIVRGAPGGDIIKWGCLAGLSYLFVVFWLNYSLYWAATLVPWAERGQPGMSFLIDPINLTSFLATVFGLLLIAIFGLVSVLPAIRKPSSGLVLRRIGAVMVALGAYFVLIILLYFLSGGYTEHPTVWHELMGPHNADLWCVAFIALGLRLLAGRWSDKGI